jgi:hypothetical protein
MSWRALSSRLRSRRLSTYMPMRCAGWVGVVGGGDAEGACRRAQEDGMCGLQHALVCLCLSCIVLCARCGTGGVHHELHATGCVAAQHVGRLACNQLLSSCTAASS